MFAHMLVLASAVNGPDIARTVQIISPVTFKSFIINFVFIEKKNWKSGRQMATSWLLRCVAP